jgi:hypothetical protein
VYIRPKGSKVTKAKVIGIRKGNLYRLHFEPTRALVSASTDLGEIWHRRMVHFHHGAVEHSQTCGDKVTRFCCREA